MKKKISCCSCFSRKNRSIEPPSSSSSAECGGSSSAITAAAFPEAVSVPAEADTVATEHDEPQNPPSTSPAASTSSSEEGASSSAVVVKQDNLRSTAAFSDTLSVTADAATVAIQHDEPQTAPSTSRARGKNIIEPSSSSAEGGAPSSAVVVKQNQVLPPLPSDGASSSSADVDLDGLIERISQHLEHIKDGTKSSQTKGRHSLPASKTFFKVKELISEAIRVGKDVVPGDTIKTVAKGFLQGMGTAHLVTSGLLVLANVIEKFEEVDANKTKCVRLLKEMLFLGKLIKQYNARALLMEGPMHHVIKEATESIVERSLLCFSQLDSSKYSKFFKSSVNKDHLDNFREEVDRMYRQINAQMGICILDNKKAPLSRGYPEHAVGIEESVKEVIDLLEWGSQKNVVAIMLHGFGGLGKTTLADAVFSLLDIQECKYSTVQLFKHIDSKPDITELQRLILRDLAEPGETIPEIRKQEDGQRELRRMLEKVPAFIYIDNVLGQDELEQLLPRDINKAKKLRLLLTARDQDIVRRALKVKPVVYAMKGLPHTEALRLLEREIYDETDDKDRQINSTKLNNIVQLYGGIPKLLELVGAFIRVAEDKQNAYETLMKEREVCDSAIGEIEPYLFSYNHLPKRAKDPFLDICSFFKGWDWETVADIVGQTELDMLRSRALVSKGTNGAVIVHDVILSIGLQKTSGMRFRFTEAKQMKELLDDRDEKEIQEIRGIWLSENKDLLNISASKLSLMYSSLRVLALGNFIKVQGKCDKTFEKLVFLQAGIPYLPFDVSTSKGLRYLKYEPKDLNFPQIPSTLRHMEFDGRLHSRAAFEISSDDLQQLGSLRILRLTNFEALKTLPEEVGALVNGLEELTLSYCTSVRELPGSISKLSKLKVFRLDYCSSLSQLPTDFGSLSSLQELNLKGCKNLKALPDNFEKLTALRLLDLSFCEKLLDLPHGLGNLTSLAELYLTNCSQLTSIPENIGQMKSLALKMNMSNCSQLTSFPESIGQMKSLALKMNMSDCSSLKELPNGFCNLSFIKHLSLTRCSTLEKLPDRFGELESLRVLTLAKCTSLKKLPESFGQLKNLTVLDISNCSNLEELCNDFHCLDSLVYIYLDGCHSLKRLPEYFHSLVSLRILGLCDCPMLEGKEMDNVVKIKTLQVVSIERSQMLLKRWGKIQREGKPGKPLVITGKDLPHDIKENIEKNLLSEFDSLLSNEQGGPFHLSHHLREDSLFLVVFDYKYDTPWALFEDTIHEIPTKFEMIYIGHNFNELPRKIKAKIVGRGDMDARGLDVYAKMFSTLDIADQYQGGKKGLGWKLLESLEVFMKGKNTYFQMTSKMVGDKKGLGWKLLTSLEVEEFLLTNCRNYHRLKQLVLTSGEGNIELLRELFASGKGQDSHIFQKNYASHEQGSNENSKPFSCGVEELKGKRIFLEIRPIDMPYDIRLGSLIQLYNTKKESLNLEVISIPLLQSKDDIRSDVFEQFSGNVPWLVLQNPSVLTRAVKYFLIKECLPDGRPRLWDEEDGIVYKSIITIIEPNGKIFTPCQPVLPLLDRWGAKAYPFTQEKIKELELEEWSQMESMSALEFLFHNQESVAHQVKEVILQQKMICLFGGNGFEGGTSMQDLKNVLIEVSDNIQLIYIPGFDLKEAKILELTENSYVKNCPLENLDMPKVDMEGISLLNLLEHNAIRFWTRISSLRKEIDMQLGRFKTLLDYVRYSCPWMILIDQEVEMIIEGEKDIVSYIEACKIKQRD